MIRYGAVLPSEAPDYDDPLDLDDPFIGLLGQKTGREDLWLGKAVPRYTSYPPATVFRDDVTAQDYKNALAGLSAQAPVSLYLHVPFCKALCLYCGCNTCPTNQHERITNYMNVVHRELENIARLSDKPRRISRIHFGGGSPNILSEKDLGLLFGTLMRRFDMSDCGEIAMELDPRLVTKAQAKVLNMLGITRVSLGVQDFNPEVQAAIGREQPYEMVKDVCALLRSEGVRHINFDLLYGLPVQSPATLAQTAREAVSLFPDRVALFSYAHVPQVKPHQKALEHYIMPGPHACLAMEGAARRVLRDAGYVEIGMDHFAAPADSLTQAAKEGRLRRSFQGYTDDGDDPLLGVGASSIGFVGDAFYQNVRTPEDYAERLRSHGFATSRGLRLSGEDKLRAAVIESLMCTLSVNLEALCREHHYSLATFSDELAALGPFERAGIIRREGYSITLTIPHRMAIRVIAALFDRTDLRADAPISRAV